MRRKALAQWADADMRAKMVSKLRVAKVKQRIGYGDLTLTSFCETKPDGRKYGRYRDAEGRRHMIFRSRWLWERANGPIPKGRLVHHKNLDPTDDRLENFELLTNPQHVSLHDGEENRRRRGKDKRPRKRAVALA